MENLQFELENIDDSSVGLEKTKQQLKSQQDTYLDNMIVFYQKILFFQMFLPLYFEIYLIHHKIFL